MRGRERRLEVQGRTADRHRQGYRGTAWESVPHGQAQVRADHSGEGGLAGTGGE
jgi:hypothetical protein